MTRRALAAVVTVTACLAASAVRVSAQPSWQPALDLYAAASYDEALQALDALDRESLDVDGLVAVEQHRMLCLMALGRSAGAEQAAEALVRIRPDFALGARDASPRVRAMFDATRRRVLPALARRLYAEAKRAYDAGDHQQARDGFAGLAALLADAQLASNDPSLDDLRTLTDGFRQLSAAALERGSRPGLAPTSIVIPPSHDDPVPTPEPASMAVLEATPFPSEMTVAVAIPSVPAFDGDEPVPAADPPAAPVDAPAPIAPVVAAATAAPSRPFTPLDIFTYDWRDKDVTPPTPVAQPISGWWGSMGEPARGTRLGVVDLVVDEHGRVADAFIYQSVNRVYDAVLLASVKQWQYQPATRGGRAVKYRRVTGVVSGR